MRPWFSGDRRDCFEKAGITINDVSLPCRSRHVSAITRAGYRLRLVIEVVAMGDDLATANLEDSGDRQVEALALPAKAVDALSEQMLPWAAIASTSRSIESINSTKPRNAARIAPAPFTGGTGMLW